ncbi:MAG TPA: efflux RND transporter permease subunit [Polyangiaceae bacterium]|nr:efflux RND transporter permease subunit [Polyangiaceae bacterium]
MQWLAQVCVRRPVFAAVLMLLVVVFGAVGYGRLGLDELPNADLPIVVVTARLPGAAPEEIESEIVDKIEGAVNTVGGIDELRSTSSEGVGQVVVSFVLDKDGDVAAQEVRDKVNAVLGELPAGVEPPAVAKVDLNAAPVLLVALRSGLPAREATELADKLVRRRVESVDGVGQVTLIGGRKRQVNVLLDPFALRAAGLSAADVRRALGAQNLAAPGGDLAAGPASLGVRVRGRVASPDELGRVVLREDGGRPLRLADVARVEDGAEEPRSFAQLDGEPAVVLAVRKQSGRNTVAVVDAVKARLAEVGAALPAGARLEIVRDNSAVVRTSVHAVTEHLVVGGLLAALVVLFFLGDARSTLIAALAIPVSIVGTFAAMWAQGFTLNVLTLLALALAVGIVIDDAIVVLENVVRHVEGRGEKPFVAAVLATREIGLAVLATTLSLLAVFVPVAFMGGIVGRYLKSFGLTMAFAIAVSLLVSFSLTPALAARWLAAGHGGAAPRPALARAVDAAYRPLERAYVALLRAAMRRRWAVVAACALALAATVPLGATLGGGFMPPNDNAQFEVSVRAPEGTSLAETRLVAERIAADVGRLPGVAHTLLAVGADEQETKNLAKITAFLTDPAAREASQLDLMDRVRREIIARAPAGLRVTTGEVQGVSTGDAATQSVQYALTGPDLGTLAELAERLTEGLRRAPGAVDVDNTLALGKPGLAVEVDRDRAADVGVEVADVADALRVMLAGQKVSSYAERGETYDVTLRADPRFRADPAALGALTVPSAQGAPVPLAGLVRARPDRTPAQITRLARARQVTIVANSAPGVGDTAVEAALRDLAAREGLPPGYALAPVGFSKETGRTAEAFAIAFGLSFVLMYLVLAAQFESWLHPITILLTLPLTVPFGLLSLHLFGQGVNLFTALGLLVLFGVVKKNAILQIDHTLALRAAGVPRDEAIVEANRDRLRPILMTTVAFVAGMVPLIVSRGVGAGQNQAIAGIVVGGQALSLVLTLLAVPVFYSLFDDLIARRARRARPGRPAPVDRGEADLARLLGAPAEPHRSPAPGAE